MTHVSEEGFEVGEHLDPEEQDRAELERRIDEEHVASLRDAIASVLGTEEGRQVLHWITYEVGKNRHCFSVNAIMMAMNEGHREMGEFIDAELRSVSPTDHLRMLSEALERSGKAIALAGKTR